MATKKLNKQDRRMILGRIITHRFKSEVEAHNRARNKFTDKVYHALYKPSQLKKMKALPKGWLPTNSAIHVRVGADYAHLYFKNDNSIRVRCYGEYVGPAIEPEEGVAGYRIFLEKDDGTCVVYDAMDKLSEEHTSLKNRQEDIKAAIGEAANSAWVTLDSVTTLNKLKFIWPEVESFCYGIDDAKQHANLPAVIISDANAALDLPPETKASA